MSNPPTQNTTARPSATGAGSTRAPMASHTHTGDRPRAAPSQKWLSTVHRLVKLYRHRNASTGPLRAQRPGIAEQGGGGHEQAGTDQQERPHNPRPEHAGRQVTHGRARVGCVDVPVRDPVEGHGRGPGEHHGRQNEHHVPPRPGAHLRDPHRAQDGERQREQRVAEPDHLEDGAHAVQHGLSQPPTVARGRAPRPGGRRSGPPQSPPGRRWWSGGGRSRAWAAG